MGYASSFLSISALSRCLVIISLTLITACSSPPTVVEDQSSEGEDVQIRFSFPLKSYRRMSRGFGGRHKGVDLSAKKGTPIYASESGWVTYRGRRFRGFGKLLILEHSRNWASFYAHLNAYNVKEKQWVNKGDVIGYVGRTGRATGDHLHFEIRHKNTPVDPLDYVTTSRLSKL